MPPTPTQPCPKPPRLLAWGLALLCPIVALPSAHAGTSPEESVTVRLEGASATGVLPEGKPVRLRMTLTGSFLSSEHLIAVVEGGWVTRRLVSFARQDASEELTGSLTLEPYDAKTDAGLRRPARFDVSVARLHGMQLQPILTRAFYLTMSRLAPPAPTEASPPPAPLEANDVAGAALVLPPELQPVEGVPVTDGKIGEEALTGASGSPPARPYWEELNATIHRRWQTRPVRRSEPVGSRATTVSFLLLATGDAQLVQVERSSGSSAFDDEALRAVVGAHPFPPVPTAITETPVTVHVVFREGDGRSASMTPPR